MRAVVRLIFPWTAAIVGEQTLSTNVYENDRTGLLSEVQYGNGGKVQYAYDDFDRLTGVRYDGEETDRYSYEYDANGNAVLVRDHALNRVLQTGHDLADRPMDTQLRNADGSLIYRTQLDYDVQNRLVGFGEETENAAYKTGYTYDTDNRITEMDFGGDDKIRYTYDSLGRVSARTVENGTDAGKLETAYSFAAGGYGEDSTTPLVESIRQPGVSFDYAYDNRGNIISEKRYAPGTAEADKLETTYAYDALGQLIRVNDPHENATWVYSYDRGGNILNKTRYAYTTGELGTPVEYVPYAYGDANWKDKLTAYNGIPITYDAIGNPLNDGERVYTWGAGRQLKHVSMAVTGSASGLRISNGSNAESQTMLQIIASNENSVLTAHVIRNGREITDECADSAFTWTCTGGSSTRFPLHAKQISLTSAETAVGVQIACAYSETMGSYGTVQVDNNLTASHTPSTADANDTFVIENGKLKVTTASANGTDYTLNNGRLTVNNGFTGTITSTAAFTEGAQTREIDYTYDHNGLRTGKVVTEGEKTETTEYMLHGKLITHMTKRCVDENGEEPVQNLHFFYDAQSRPAFVEYNGTKYRYLQNLQGDIVGIVDGNGTLVVEYRYDAWGKPISTSGSMADTLGKQNPFRYRGYIYDEESELYYLRSRYYNPKIERFVNEDSVLGRAGTVLSHNQFSYCKNESIMHLDSDGKRDKVIDSQYQTTYYTKEYYGRTYEFKRYYVPSRKISYKWVSRVVNIGIAVAALVSSVSAMTTVKKVVARTTKKSLGKAVVKAVNKAVVTDSIALGTEVFDFSIGDIAVVGLDLLLGENAADGIYTVPGYWMDAPMEPIPGPAPTITPTPAVTPSVTIVPTATIGPLQPPMQ